MENARDFASIAERRATLFTSDTSQITLINSPSVIRTRFALLKSRFNGNKALEDSAYVDHVHREKRTHAWCISHDALNPSASIDYVTGHIMSVF